jgi:hypothetical protein
MNKKLIIAAAVVGVGYFLYNKSKNSPSRRQEPLFVAGDLFPLPPSGDWIKGSDFLPKGAMSVVAPAVFWYKKGHNYKYYVDGKSVITRVADIRKV